MARSVKFKNGIFLDASAIAGIKGAIYSSSNIDLNDLLTVKDAGVYYVSNNVPNSPVNYCALIVIPAGVVVNSTTCHQIAWDGNHIYTRSYFSANAEWSDWHRYSGSPFDPSGITYGEPKIYGTSIAHNATKTFKFSAGAAGTIVFASGYTDIRGEIVFCSESSGNVRYTTLGGISAIGLATSTSGLAITNNSSSNVSATVYIHLSVGTVKSVT